MQGLDGKFERWDAIFRDISNKRLKIVQNRKGREGDTKDEDDDDEDEGGDEDDVEKCTKDRKAWSKTFHSRMGHIERWEKQRANKPQDYETVETRNFPKIEQSLTCSQGGKTCRTAAGLGIHTKRFHNKKEPVLFPCPNCTRIFRTKNTRTNNQKSCYGEYSSEKHRTQYIMQQVIVTEKFRKTQKKMPTIRIPYKFAPSKEKQSQIHGISRLHHTHLRHEPGST